MGDPPTKGWHIGIHDHGLEYEHAIWMNDAHWDGKKWVGLVKRCHIAHSWVDRETDQLLSEMDYMECEVASQWTIVRTLPTETADLKSCITITLSPNQATFLRHVISLALRSPEFDKGQREELLAIDAYVCRETGLHTDRAS